MQYCFVKVRPVNEGIRAAGEGTGLDAAGWAAGGAVIPTAGSLDCKGRTM